jgi:hypothetical protein
MVASIIFLTIAVIWQRGEKREPQPPEALNLTECSSIPSDCHSYLLSLSYVNSIEDKERLGPGQPCYAVHWGEN